MTEPPVRVFTVTVDDEGLRLDHFLAGCCSDLSRTAIQRAVASGGVTVDGAVVPSRYRLHAGQRVTLRPLPPPPSTVEPENIPLVIAYEDDQLAVVDKPAGLVVHPAPGHRGGTLVNALLHRYGELPGQQSRAGLVHRLDKDTSGLLVVARTAAAHRHLAAQLADRSLGRVYHALCWGSWQPAAGEIDAPVGRHPRQRQRRAVVAGGRRAVTRYRVMADFGFVQLVEARLLTGRTHQIRVHFAHRHHPIVGDIVYGDDRRARNVHPLDLTRARRLAALARRQLLHAAWLRLRHPVDDRVLIFRSPWPDDMREAVRLLGGDATLGDPGAPQTTAPWTGE